MNKIFTYFFQMLSKTCSRKGLLLFFSPSVFSFIIMLVFILAMNMDCIAANKYSVATGNWTSTSTWSLTSGGSSPAAVPVAGDVVIIEGGFNVTVDVSTKNLTSLTISSGSTLTGTGAFKVTATTINVNGLYKNSSSGAITGTMTVSSTGTYEHAFTTTAGTIPTATWSDGSTCLISGYTTIGSGVSPGGLGQSFSNFTWSCSGQQNRLIAWATSMDVRADFTVANTNATYIYFANGGAGLTVSMTGNYVQSGGVMRFTRGNENVIVNINGNFTMSNGTLNIDNGNGGSTVNLSGNFNMSNGLLESLGGTTSFNFVKAGTQTYSKTGGTISADPINFTVNSTSQSTILDFGTSVIDGSTGTFVLSAGGGLITAHTQGISSTASTGCVQVTGTKTFSTSADYTYNSTTAAQVTGNALPATVNNLTINNTFSTVTLTNAAVTVNGAGNFTAGALVLNGGTLNLNGTTSVGTGTITGSAASNVGIASSNAAGMTLPNIIGGLLNFTINKTGAINTVTLGGALSVGGVATFTNGILNTTATNLLSVTNTAIVGVVGGSTTCFVSGPLAWSLPNSSVPAYSFPLGKGGVYYPFSLSSFSGTSPVLTVEAFTGDAGGSFDGSLNSVSITEYWSASYTGTYSNGSVSLTRQAALGLMDVVARSATQAGTYSSLYNTSISGTTINNSVGTGGSLGFFIMGEGKASFCTQPAAQASALASGTITGSSIQLNIGTTVGTYRIVVVKQGSAPTGVPTDAVLYSANSVYGTGGTALGDGFVVYSGSGTTVTVTGLTSTTAYYFQVFEFNCYGTYSNYNPDNLTGNIIISTSACSMPLTQVNSITFTNMASTIMTVNWLNGDGSNRIVVAKLGSAPTGSPVNGTTYPANSAYGTAGTEFGIGDGFVVYNGSGSSVSVTGLTDGSIYYFQVFEYDCLGTLFCTATGTNNPMSKGAGVYYYTRNTTGTWATSSDWSTVGCGGAAAATYPDQVGTNTDYVVICSGTTMGFPNIGTNITIKDLTIESSGILDYTSTNDRLSCDNLYIDGTISGAGTNGFRIGNSTGCVIGGTTGTISLTGVNIRINNAMSLNAGLTLTINGGASGNLDLNKKIFTNNGILKIMNSSTIMSGATGGFINATNATLFYQAPSNWDINVPLTSTAVGNTVEFASASGGPWLTDAQGSYYNLIISGASTKNLNAATVTVAGDLTINSGVLNSNIATNINIAGNWINNVGTAAFTENTGTVTFNGTADQGLTATGGEEFYNLTVNKTAGTLTLNNNVTVSSTSPGTLTMTQGNINCLTNSLTLGTSTANVGTLTHTSGTIIGKFTRWINATGAWLFPIGTATNYRSDSLIINTLTTGGSLTSEFISADPGALPGCPGACSLMDGPYTMINSFTEGYWQHTVGGGLAASDYDLYLRGENFSSRFLSSITRILNGTASTPASWTAAGSHAALVGVTAERDAITTGLGGDFCLSETDCAIPNPVVSGAIDVCKSDVVTYSVVGFVGSTYNWTITGGLPATGTGTSINVTWGATGGVANVRVEETTASTCFNNIIVDYPVMIHPYTSAITGSVGVCPNTTGVAYSVTSTPGYNYAWTITGGTQASGTITNSITVDWGAGPTGQVDVIATSPTCGADVMQSLPVYIGSYSSSAVTQTVVSTVAQGSFQNEIIKIAITTSNCTTGNLTQFNFSTAGTSGSTSALTDIADAHVFYTGTSGTYSTTTLFGSLGSAPNGAYTINGSQALTQNVTNYFWLVYDIALTATVTDDVDGQLVSFVYEGNTITNATTSDPAGKRTITAVTQYWSMQSGNWNNTTNVWSTDFGVSVCGCAPTGGSGSVVIRNTHTITFNQTSTIDYLLIQSGGRLNKDGAANKTLTVNQTLNVQGTGSFTLDKQLTVTGNSTFRGTGASTSTDKMTFGGNLDVGDTTSLVVSNGGRITVNSNLIVNGTLGVSGGSSIRLDASVAGKSISGSGTITSDNTGDKIDVRTTGRTILAGTNLTIQPYFEIRDAITITNLGIVSLVNNGVSTQGDLDGGNSLAVWINDVNSTLNYGGAGIMFANKNTKGSLTASASGNTVNYNYAGAQTIITPNSSIYYHLTGSVSGTKTALGALRVNGNLTSQDAATLTLGGLTDVNGNVSILNTAILDANSNNITLAGNWSNTSSNADPFTQGTASVTMDGSATQTISNTGDADGTGFSTLIINNTDATGVNNANTSYVGTALTLTDGYVNTSTAGLLTLLDGATTTIGSTSSYVNGPLAYDMAVSATPRTLNLPLGKGSDWRPAVITPTHSAATSYTYTAELFNASASALGWTLPGTIDLVSGVHYMDINRTLTSTGAADPSANLTGATLQMYYSSTNGTNDGITQFANVTIAKAPTAGSTWTDITATATANGTGSATSSSFTSFSRFALANKSGGSNTLPVSLLNYNAKVVGRQVENAWSTSSEMNNDFFTVEKSLDGNIFEYVGMLNGSGTSNSLLNYKLFDTTPYAGLSFYRLKQTDFDGKFTYSNMISVNFRDDAEVFDYSMFSSLKNVYITLQGVCEKEDVNIVINDMMGKVVYSKDYSMRNGNKLVVINVNKWTTGTYIINISCSNRLISKKLLLNQY